jgi:hypothetical protein
MSNSKQSISNSKAKGAMRQKTDAAKADQSVSEASADSIDQTVSGQQQTLGLGKYKASGKWAVIALVIVAASFLVLRYIS